MGNIAKNKKVFDFPVDLKVELYETHNSMAVYCSSLNKADLLYKLKKCKTLAYGTVST